MASTTTITLLPTIDPNEIYGSTLIAPSVALGNVGQLTIDLIVENFKFKRVGTFNSLFLTSVFGPNPYSDVDNNKFASNGEVYYDSTLKITIIQLRASIIPKYLNNFVSDLLQLFTTFQFSQVLMLTSYDKTLREDSMIQKDCIRYLSTDKDLKILSGLEGILPLPTDNKSLELDTEFDSSLPGSGYAGKLFRLAQKHNFDKLNLLILSVTEGDNGWDAANFATTLLPLFNSTLPCPIEDEFSQDKRRLLNGWVTPPSWSHLFGNSTLPELY